MKHSLPLLHQLLFILIGHHWNKTNIDYNNKCNNSMMIFLKQGSKYSVTTTFTSN